MRFTKMHGCGNDYIFVDCSQHPIHEDPDQRADLARRMSDRHTGIGGDGLILVGPSSRADARMEVYNADGSLAEMCGNGVRCAAALAHAHGIVSSTEPLIETGAGLLRVRLELGPDGRGRAASVDMGIPRLSPDEVPVTHPGPGPLLELTLKVAGSPYRILAIGMGNPHAVIVVPDAEQVPILAIGPLIERHAAFPHRTNVEFVSPLPFRGGRPAFRQRTWERGSGETMACGTGACATVVAAILDRRMPAGAARVVLNGGELDISWAGPGHSVTMTGPVAWVFDGDWEAA